MYAYLGLLAVQKNLGAWQVVLKYHLKIIVFLFCHVIQ